MASFVTKDGDPRETYLAPFQVYKQQQIGKERNDLLDMWKKFEDDLGEGIDHPISMIKNNKSNTVSTIGIHSMQTGVTTSINTRIDMYQKHSKKVLVELFGDELEEQRSRVINEYNERMRVLEEKLQDRKLKTAKEKKTRKRKFQQFAEDQLIKILPIANSFMDVYITLATKSTNIVMDFNALKQAYDDGWLSDKDYSESLGGFFGMPINKKRRIVKDINGTSDNGSDAKKKAPEPSKDGKTIKNATPNNDKKK